MLFFPVLMYLVGHTEQLFKIANLIYTVHDLLVEFFNFKWIHLLKVTFLGLMAES